MRCAGKRCAAQVGGVLSRLPFARRSSSFTRRDGYYAMRRQQEERRYGVEKEQRAHFMSEKAAMRGARRWRGAARYAKQKQRQHV